MTHSRLIIITLYLLSCAVDAIQGIFRSCNLVMLVICICVYVRWIFVCSGARNVTLVPAKAYRYYHYKKLINSLQPTGSTLKMSPEIEDNGESKQQNSGSVTDDQVYTHLGIDLRF